MAGALLNCYWVAARWLAPDLRWTRSFVSELGAVTEPRHLLVNALDLCSGALITFFATRLTAALPRGRLARYGCLSLTVFGACSALDGFAVMDCAPSLSATCRAKELALQTSWHDIADSALSVVAVVAFLSSVVLLSAALQGAEESRAYGRVGWGLLAVSAPLSLVVGLLGWHDVHVGMPQRALLTLQSAWVLLLVAATARGPTVAAAGSRHPVQRVTVQRRSRDRAMPRTPADW